MYYFSPTRTSGDHISQQGPRHTNLATQVIFLGHSGRISGQYRQTPGSRLVGSDISCSMEEVDQRLPTPCSKSGRINKGAGSCSCDLILKLRQKQDIYYMITTQEGINPGLEKWRARSWHYPCLLPQEYPRRQSPQPRLQPPYLDPPYPRPQTLYPRLRLLSLHHRW